MACESPAEDLVLFVLVVAWYILGFGDDWPKLVWIKVLHKQLIW